jgi:hypothetical protein
MNSPGWWHRLRHGRRPAPVRDAWPAICTTIAQGFEAQRQEFWSTLLRRIHLARTGNDPVVLPIVRRTLGGQAELALKAYQLYVASVTIGHHEYISPADGHAFTHLLYVQVCGTALPQALRFVQSYREVEHSVGLARLAGDIGDYIMGSHGDVRFYAFCLLPLDAFVTLSMVVVCAAFNDLAEGQRLMERATQRMAQGVSLP